MDSLFFDLFEAMPRQAPGSVRATLRALSSLSVPPHKLSILDIGCGAGAQTLTLARHLAGHILAVDNHQPFLDALKTRAEATELRATVECRLADMRTLTFPDGSFDLVWAEGSIYIMGFGRRTLHGASVPEAGRLCGIQRHGVADRRSAGGGVSRSSLPNIPAMMKAAAVRSSRHILAVHARGFVPRRRGRSLEELLRADAGAGPADACRPPRQPLKPRNSVPRSRKRSTSILRIPHHSVTSSSSCNGCDTRSLP